MINRKRSAEASPDTRRLTCCEDITDILDGKASVSARKASAHHYTQQVIDTVLIKQLLGSLPPYRREQVMKDLGCLSATPKKRLLQLFSPTQSQLDASAPDSPNSWLFSAPDDPASIKKPSPRPLARGSYIMQCTTLAKQACPVAKEMCPQQSPRRAVVGSQLGCRPWQGKHAMRKLTPGVNVISSSAKLTVSVCH